MMNSIHVSNSATTIYSDGFYVYLNIKYLAKIIRYIAQKRI